MHRMAVKAREFRYAIDLHEGGTLRTEDGTELVVDQAWTPEHLLLAALVRCSLTSLRFHARRLDVEVADAKGSARAMVTRRDADNRFAIVECDVDLTVRLSPQPGDDEAAKLLADAEQDCFVGASLTVKPTYAWHYK
jgi:uncharacterized OsmC-like protein